MTSKFRSGQICSIELHLRGGEVAENFWDLSSMTGLNLRESKNGGGWAYQVEHQALNVSLKRKVPWARNTADLAVLAKLRLAEGLRLDEIAEKMGISRSSVDRGMRQIRSTNGKR